MEHEFFFRGLERQRLIYSILQVRVRARLGLGPGLGLGLGLGLGSGLDALKVASHTARGSGGQRAVLRRLLTAQVAQHTAQALESDHTGAGGVRLLDDLAQLGRLQAPPG